MAYMQISKSLAHLCMLSGLLIVADQTSTTTEPELGLEPLSSHKTHNILAVILDTNFLGGLVNQ